MPMRAPVSAAPAPEKRNDAPRAGIITLLFGLLAALILLWALFNIHPASGTLSNASGSSSLNRTFSVLWEALPRILTAGLTMTIPLTLLSFSLAMVLAVVVALVQYAHLPVLSPIARFYIWVIRGTPLLVQLFIIFYGLPSVGIMLDAFPAAVIAFAFNEGAYCAETMRGALESVPQGQLEAGYCVGMSWWQIMRRIVLPQALRTAVPALSNSLIGMIKDTSLASNITVAELFMAGQRVAARTYIFLPIYCEVAVVYLLFCTVITKLQGLLERRLNARGFQ